MEFLKDILGEELFAQVAEKLSENESIKLANIADGQYIPKSKFDAERSGAKALKTQIEELQGRITELQNENAGADTLKVQLAQIQRDLEAKDAQIKAQRMDFALMEAARAHKAKDPEIIAQMIDRSQIAEQGDGYIGMDEQLDAIAKAYSYMFESEPAAPVGGFDPLRVPQGGTTENAVMNNLIRAAAGR